MYFLSVHNSDWNTAETGCSGHTRESGNTVADKVTDKGEGSCAMACDSSSVVICSIGAAVEGEGEEEGREGEGRGEEERESEAGEEGESEAGDEGELTSGRDKQLQL
jgi:hypothetical protein